MKICILLIGVILSFNTYAGGTVGNGGNTVVCKDSAGQITKLEVFDLYEGRVLRGLSYAENSDDYSLQAQQIIARLAKTLNQRVDTDGGVIDLLNRITKNLIFLPSGTGLKPIPDGAEFILPKGCDIVQTINFHDFDHIYVDSDIWTKLSPTQKASLLVHETIYWYLRDTGPKGNFVEVNSIRSRKAVALLFSGISFVGLEDFENTAGKKPVFCRTMNALEADRPSTHFYAFPTSDGKINFQFINMLDRILLTKATLTSYPADSSNWPTTQIDQPWSAEGKVNSIMDSDFYVSVQWWPLSPSNNHILVRDSDGNSAWESFVCEPQ